MLDLPTKVWLANEIRIWGLAVAAIIAAISFAATWAHSRWQAELANQREEAAKIRQMESDERIANATATAATANAEAARLRLELDREIQKRAQRILTDEQRALLLSELRGRIPKIFVVVQRDLEARAFALQLQIVFQEAGAIIHPVDLPAGEVLAPPAGIVMHSPGIGSSEEELKDDPLYRGLKKAGLYGGATSKPFASLELSPATPMLPSDEYVVYIGQKPPW